MKKNELSRKTGLSGLSSREGLQKALLLALGVFVVRALGALLLRPFLTLVIDENLYTSLAKGLLDGFTVSYRGQPINYPYLFYPLLLTPVYLLERLLGGDIYRWIQVFNSLLMASTVIPAYLFARDFTGDTKKALIGAGLCALMPDGVLSGFLLSESVIWPLSAWLLFTGWRAFRGLYEKKKEPLWGVLTGAIAFLMYFTKPGAVTMGALLCVALLILGLRNKKTQEALLPVITLAGLIIVWTVIYKLCLDKTSGGLIGLYSKQTEGWKVENIPVMLKGIPVMLIMAVFALCGVFAVYPFVYRNEYDEPRRWFIPAVAAGVVIVCIGTAVFVTPYQWTSGLPMHLRYASMFLPAFFVFTFALPEQPRLKARAKAKQKPAKSTLIMILLAVILVLFIFPGARTGFVSGDNTVADSITLSGFLTTERVNGELCGTLETILVCAFLLYMIFFHYENSRDESCMRLCTGFVACLLLFNNVCAYFSGHSVFNTPITEDALEMKQMLAEEDEKPLGVTQIYYDNVYTYWVESHLDRAMQQVTNQQLNVSLNRTGGVYQPITPADQAPNVNSGETVDTGTFMFNFTVHEHMEFAPLADVRYTKNRQLALVKVPRGERLLDTSFDGLNLNKLTNDLTAQIIIYDPERMAAPQLHVQLEAIGNGEIIMDGQSCALTDTLQTYDFIVSHSNTIPVSVSEGGEAQIISYRTWIPGQDENGN